MDSAFDVVSDLGHSLAHICYIGLESEAISELVLAATSMDLSLQLVNCLLMALEHVAHGLERELDDFLDVDPFRAALGSVVLTCKRS